MRSHSPQERVPSVSTPTRAAIADAPRAPREWQPALRRLFRAFQARRPEPAWWTDQVSFFATLETVSAGSHYDWDGVRRFKKGDAPFAFIQITLAGWGAFAHERQAQQRILPGTGFVALVPSRHRYHLPADSPGWTFAWINVFHPYLIERLGTQMRSTGSLLHFGPDSAFFASVLRVVSGNLKKDFRDRFEVELALFELVLAYERLALESTQPADERDALLDGVRSRILADLKRPLDVAELAGEYGMSRSHFSRLFRARTGLTPARVVAQTRIQAASAMLLADRLSIKEIAAACGFANANHFSKVFHRYRQVSPGAYKKQIP